MSRQHIYDCARCQRSFGSHNARQQHLLDSAKHNICIECNDKPDFNTQDELDEHKRDRHADLQSSLFSISARHPNVIKQLVDIQSSQVDQQKSREFLEKLECLYFLGFQSQGARKTGPLERDLPVLRRRDINAYLEQQYVALSYTWSPSPLEKDLRTGGYIVEGRERGRLQPSLVRNSVFARIRKYMDHVSARYLWIDHHCVEQREGEPKEIGMQAMDRVYSLSKYPAALLFRPIGSLVELQLLAEVLTGQLVHEDRDGLWISSRTTLDRALRAVELLGEITSDSWFTRGWTYQENYRAGTRMTLLIPDPQELNKQKPHNLLGSLDGELCVNSADFHKGATRLCLAYQSHQPPPARLDQVLARAGKYTVLLQHCHADGDHPAPKSMSPTIIADLVARDLDKDWDRLPLAANCCQYSIRLNSTELRANGRSLSLSTLALCLVNGEILSNHQEDDYDVAEARSLTVADFLETHFFDGLQAPSPSKRLTFNKGCRFTDVKLTEEGVQTKGHLWRLDKLIATEDFSGGPRHLYEPSLDEALGFGELLRLEQLANKLSYGRDQLLSSQLEEFIARNRHVRRAETFSQKWQVRMAKNIAMAINEGKLLYTARLTNRQQPGRAVFIVDFDGAYSGSGESSDGSSGGTDEDSRISWSFRSVDDHRGGTAMDGRVFECPTYMFTSLHAAREGSGMFDSNDIDRHVSMEVDCPDIEGRHGRAQVPRLFTKRWIHGLCFFGRCPQQDVLFPWPASLQDL